MGEARVTLPRNRVRRIRALARLLPPPPPRPLAAAQRLKPPGVVQRAAAATFAPTKRVAPGRPQGMAEELVGQPDGTYRVRDGERGTLGQPNGVYNFVRVQGARRGDAAVLVSPKMPHAHLAAGRPVIYAGTAKLESGKLDWWSNFSGTYQPVAEFRAQASLPVDKFVTWQKLQLGGTAMQRGMLGERRQAPAPQRPGSHAERQAPAKNEEKGGQAGSGQPSAPAKVVGKTALR